MDAPIAILDDDWDNFSSFSSPVANKEAEDVNHNEEVSSFEAISHDSKPYQSMEDLVHSFEETLASCFRIENKPMDNNNNTSNIHGLEESLYLQNSVWKRITDNYGLVQPLNWNNSHIRKLHLPALELAFGNSTELSKTKDFEAKLDIEDNELYHQMDLHRMVECNAYHEQENPLFYTQSVDTDEPVMQTADEVIQELELIMMNAEDENEAADLEVQEETGIIISDNFNATDDTHENLREQRRSIASPSSQEESDRASDLKYLTTSQLSSICNELELEVKNLSAELLQQLNARDELQYENEIRNNLISSVLEVQYKQEQFRKANPSSIVSGKKFGRLKRSATIDSVADGDGRYLTTVIPCNKSDLSLSNLQALIKLLNAMKSDSEEVPTLLTSYILTVLVPAPSGSKQQNLKL